MDRVGMSAKGNQRERVMAVLVEHASEKGYVRDMDVQGIARLTGIDLHDVAKHLWGMQKQGLVGFSTKHVQGRTVPYRFRLTARGLRDSAPEPTERPSEAAEPAAGIQGPEPNEKPKEAAPVRQIATTIPMTQEALDDADAMMDARPPGFTREAFPQIFALIEREDRREQVEAAARALEAAGLDDLAVQALEAIPPMSPLEQEIRTLVRLFWRKDWEQPGASLREMLEGAKPDAD